MLETEQAVTNRDRDSRGIVDYPTSVMQSYSNGKYTHTNEHDPALVGQKPGSQKNSHDITHDKKTRP